MHVHASALDFLVVGAMALIFSALWRVLAGRLSASERPGLETLGAGMAAVYS